MKKCYLLQGLLTACCLLANDVIALTGVVVTSQGKAIAGAKITLVGEGLEVVSDDLGQFTVPQERVDELHVAAPGFSHQVIHLHEQDDLSEPLTITMQVSAIEQVDVIGLPLHASTMESAQPISVISGEELRSKQASTLGETLANEVGVNTSYFGPVASSPIIRGLDGPRVLITQNGLDVGDVSRIGPDHVVSTEASTAKQIEILRGPATLFFGSGAIGGVVNVVDDRVPSDNQLKGAYTLSHNTVANQNDVSAAITSGVVDLAIHADGFWRENDDYRIPVPAERDHENEQVTGEHTLENSAGDSYGGNLGASWLLDKGYVGLSFGTLDKLNGVPGHHHGEEHDDANAEEAEHVEEGRVLSELSQDRWQLISEIALDAGWLAGINTRAGYTDYRHTELHELDTGVRIPETEFSSTTQQLRIDLLQRELGGWRGATSLEFAEDELDVQGEEAFTPYTETQRYALAIMEEKHAGSLLWQLGARVEQVSLDAVASENGDALPAVEKAQLQQQFTPVSLSFGTVWDFHPSYNLGISLTHAERAASAGELFAAGPHTATGTYELGAIYAIAEDEEGPHITLGTAPQMERSANIDLSLRKHQGAVGFVLNAFYNNINNYYYLANTGLDTHELFSHEEPAGAEAEAEHEAHDLPVYLYQQNDAALYGLEAEVFWQISSNWKARFWGDALRARLRDGTHLPRMPAHRLATQWLYQYSSWSFDLNAVHTFEQNELAPLETPSDAYTLVDAQLSYSLPGVKHRASVFLKGENLTNEEARLHTSFLKDVAPIPGRGFRIGIRGEW